MHLNNIPNVLFITCGREGINFNSKLNTKENKVFFMLAVKITSV